MLGACSSIPLVEMITSGFILLLWAIWVVYQKSRQDQAQVDENQRLVIQLTITGIFALLVFIAFLFIWKPC